MDNEAYIPLIENLNIRQVQWDIDEPKRIKAKQQPLQGDDLHRAALDKIYLCKGRFDKREEDKLAPIKDYISLLQD